ncbi:MAG: ScpA family protein [Thermomicrobiales bacterium]
METTTAVDRPVPTLAGYQLHLPDFEGPLDVLLRLVERSQLAIADVSLVAVLDQFLTYVDQLEGAGSSVIAEFTMVGTRLTLLKTRSLLPRPPAVEEEEDPNDLTRQLIEYKRLRDAARLLGEIHATGGTSFGIIAPRSQAFAKDAGNFRLANYEPVALWRSIRRRVAHIPQPEQILQQKPMLTLRDVIARATSLISGTKETTFLTLVAPYTNRTEVATAFLATLVLMRRRIVDAEQTTLFGEIRLRQAAEDPVGTEDDALSEFEPA